MSEAREVRLPARERVVAPPPDAKPLDLKTRLIVRLGTWLIFALGSTWRVRVFGRNQLTSRTPDDPRVVMTLWHGQLLPAAWAHRQPAAALVSEHRDGEIIARIVGRLGVATVRGSSSRGGARALLECVKALRQDKMDMVITPDGPRGPRHSFAPGALIVAFRAQVPVVPLVVHVDRAWRLRSWDQFEIPKPFARVTVYYGEPVPVHGEDVREVSAQCDAFAARLQSALVRVGELARTA